ncbi:adenosylcobinamide-GDP ribazoletransferase [Nocardioides sambongensis]|uniref:adenosylcobinamide-GDP ribazoletransferase n=1 Tax=Nocardioides sambongensis TaxID=2589074 RepID=UPI00112C68E7|nr:adenosylcobinamide-GDP ribazoletransferase [Nocardioides sambongensis]
MSHSAPLRGLGLAVGMLTALPVPAVLRLTPAVARSAMLCAPLAAVPLAALVVGVLRGGDALGLPPLVIGFVAVGALAAGSRALHLDGLSDTVDGLTASYDRERSLAVMKGGTAGPAGVAALVVVLGAQAAAFAALSGDLDVALLAAAAVIVSRAALWLAAASIVPPARPDGLGVSFTGSVPAAVALLGWIAIGIAAALVDPVRGPLTVLVAALAVALVLRRAVRRFGGVTGDVFGACVEVALAVLLVGATTF